LADGRGAGADAPELHVPFDIEQVFGADSPWLSGGCFEHEAAEFRVEDGGSFSVSFARLAGRYVDGGVYLLEKTAFRIWGILSGRERGQNICLSQRQPHFSSLFVDTHHQILDLFSITKHVSKQPIGCSHPK
jgi:hypothetical protein